jgi:hypothetical protein
MKRPSCASEKAGRTLASELWIVVQMTEFSQVPVAQAYNPSYSGDRDQEVHCSKPVWTKGS